MRKKINKDSRMKYNEKGKIEIGRSRSLRSQTKKIPEKTENISNPDIYLYKRTKTCSHGILFIDCY